jgi:tRNA 5-methylaminomethyl-2-thiouridine biosynthesis bifunctional protein
MTAPVAPATLEFRDGVPYSAAYGDVYHSADGGAGQARHVFLDGCGLPERWAGCTDFVILETGFGTGTNFLATWAAWRADPLRPARLHFLSVEKHPFGRDDLAALHARWPEFAGLSAELLTKWPPPLAGFHRIALDDGRVQLTLMLGDAEDCLAQVEAGVDAFYLDGFAPDRNPELWHPELIARLARLARPGALAATYSVAAPVRAVLSRAGFVCEKRAGYGRKRHCLRASHAGHRIHAFKLPRRVVVVGAGVAGSAVAHALAQRGIPVSVLERAPAPAAAASGNPVAVFRPVLARTESFATRLTRAAFLHDLRTWPELGERLEWARCGVLHLARDAGASAHQREALAAAAPPADHAYWVDVAAACRLANWPVAAPGVFYPQAGWIVPGGVCRAWLGHPDITLRTACEVARLEAVSTGWRLFDARDGVVDEADAVVLANAHEAGRLVPGAAWPLHAVRGQITRLPPGSLPGVRRVVAREGYFAPGTGPALVGATYEHDDLDLAPRAASDRANLARLETMLPGATAQIRVDEVGGRAALRATVPDRLPLLGAVHGAPGLYVAAAYASRGVTWAGLLGEALADVITGAPLPLERDLMAALDPRRFAAARVRR